MLACLRHGQREYQPVEDLTIDHEFDELCPPLTADEERLLEESILADGCLHPIVTWAGHDDTILDGHNRYRLCRKHDRIWKTKAIRIETREEAKAWIIRQQIGRRNLNETQRADLAAKLVNSHVGRPNSANMQNLMTTEKAAEDFNVSERLVSSAVKVHEKGSAALNKAMAAGVIPATTAAVIAELPKAEQTKIVKKGPEAAKAKAKEVKQEKAAVKQYNDPFDPKEIEKQQPKNGSEKGTQFKDGVIDELYGKLFRAVDDRWNKVGGHGVNHGLCVKALRDFGAAWAGWRKSK
jgi:hypothetical protein